MAVDAGPPMALPFQHLDTVRDLSPEEISRCGNRGTGTGAMPVPDEGLKPDLKLVKN
jgi:hypothetical protein